MVDKDCMHGYLCKKKNVKLLKSFSLSQLQVDLIPSKTLHTFQSRLSSTTITFGSIWTLIETLNY